MLCLIKSANLSTDIKRRTTQDTVHKDLDQSVRIALGFSMTTLHQRSSTHFKTGQKLLVDRAAFETEFRQFPGRDTGKEWSGSEVFTPQTESRKLHWQ